ncbi:MAG TPA: T9SS type A sorting domain-containing protein, partial [Rubricoccaceae bacterium]|nr:T9SS type A sorting domain-containing protein [Rubricoccaceae bacterium]
EDCAPYDRIYKVSRFDVERYYETGNATDDLRDWPHHLGAPVLDGDGIEGNYDLAGGDQPAISGEQTAWWVMNDAGNEHRRTRTAPIRLEASVEAFAVANAAWPVRQATVYRYRLTYRGEVPLGSVYVGAHWDPDLGDAPDDMIGADTLHEMTFVFNASSTDAVYGVPPAAGVQVVQGPVGLPNGLDDDRDGEVDEEGERLGMTSHSYFIGGGNAGTNDPGEGVGMYNRLKGLWNDGTPMTARGNGYQTNGQRTTFAFPGDPVTDSFWSEENPNNGPGQNAGQDRRGLISTGPLRLEPGETEEIVFAIVFAQGTDRLDSITQLRVAARYIKNAYEVGLYDPRLVPGGPEPPEVPDEVLLSRPYPNPFMETATVRFSVPEAAPVRLSLYDALGREVAVAFDGTAEAGEHAVVLGEGLPPGLYLVRFDAPGARRAFPLVKLRP